MERLQVTQILLVLCTLLSFLRGSCSPNLTNLTNLVNVTNVTKLVNVTNLTNLVNVTNVTSFVNVTNVTKLVNAKNTTNATEPLQATTVGVTTVTTVDVCEKMCNKANAIQRCFTDHTCPGLGCNALGVWHCRYCGFGAYASVNCPGPAKPPVEPPVKPPIEPVEPSPPGSCSPLGTFKCNSTCFRDTAGPEINVFSRKPGDRYFENHITADGFEEQLQCSKVYGIGGTNMYSCVTATRRERLRAARFLQQLTFSIDCNFFVKTVWRMSPPVATCTVLCPLVKSGIALRGAAP